MFDIFDNPYVGYSNVFNISQNTNLSDQIQALGYGPNSSMINLGSICLYIFYYFIRVFIYYMLNITVCCCGIGQKKRKAIKQRVFWNDFIGLALDGYIEFLICGVISYYSPADVNDSSLYGDILSKWIGYYILGVSFIIIPAFLINMYS